jgi:hypothetical protein
VGAKVNKSIIDDTEDKIFAYEISDAALEIAAGVTKAGTVSLTIAFCSGMDYCQPKSPHAFGMRAIPRRVVLRR